MEDSHNTGQLAKPEEAGEESNEDLRRELQAYRDRDKRVRGEIAELQVHGSGALIRWLLANDLVDEITLFVCPMVVGQGTRLLPDTGPDAALDLVESRSTPKGVTIQVYRPTGRPQYETARPTPDT